MSKKWREIHRRMDQEVPAVQALFLRKYPKAFFPKDSIDTQPLAIGVRGSLVRDNPEIEWYLIEEALARYVGKNRYQRAIATRPNRVNLDGSISGPVEQKHRDRAIEQLLERQKTRVLREAA